MLVDLILSGVFGLLNILFGGVYLPRFPDGFLDIMSDFASYTVTGVRVLGAYVDLSYLFLLFKYFIDIVLFYDLYLLVMWILRKIPLLGIK